MRTRRLADEESRALEQIEAALREGKSKGDQTMLYEAQRNSAILHNSAGRYQAALGAAQRAYEDRSTGEALSELIEAAVRSGEPERAAAALEPLSERTQLGGSDWGLGVEARSRALLSEGPAAEDRYREAIEHLGRTRMRLHLARVHLLYGEWLRRENRRTDAREQLRTAHGMFAPMGAETFAERAARKLLATGEKARKRTADTRGELTAQEAQIAKLARKDYSNPEIGAQLFISPRTVEYHLHKVFTKLAISSRTQLDGALLSETREAQPV